jgi:signal transduction histidine kinase/DNA-binding NarL/FixJ family response regulator
MKNVQDPAREKMFTLLAGVSLLIGLYWTSHYNYLLFHTLAELFSIVVACGIFMIAWNSRKYIENSYLTWVAVAYLFVGGIDLLHTLSYKGMPIFKDYDYYANQLWIGARYLESLTLLTGFYFLTRTKTLRPEPVFVLYTLISLLLILSVFYWKIFPECFVAGKGQTRFKIFSEYMICSILIFVIGLLFKFRDHFENTVFRWLLWSLIFTIGSELAFTFYIDNYGFSNLIGHYFKIFSFFLVYKALIETGIVRPFDIIFRELVQKEKILEQARKAADAANQAKSDFLANMSHELRTPLNGILGYAQILNRDERLSSSQQDSIRIIEQSGHHLLNLINEILDLSKIEAQKMEIIPADFRLTEFIRGITQMIRIRAAEKEIDFVLETSPDLPEFIRADEKRLGQILLNLLSNAVKFTDRGRVIFRVKPASESNFQAQDSKEGLLQTLRFEVEDTGVGIGMDKLEEIFEPFKQVGNQSRYIEGTGLGLAISNKLVRLMGGEIDVRSEENKGSLFSFELTLPSTAGPSLSITSEKGLITGYLGHRRRLLIADDRPENRSVLVNLLGSLGFQIAEAVNGKEAVEKIREYKPDLIFMDLMMPVQNGFEAAAEIRSLPDFNTVKIIAVSASFSPSSPQVKEENRFDDFIAKPVSFPEIFAAIEKHLSLEWTYKSQSLTQPRWENEELIAEQGRNVPPKPELERILYLSQIGDISGIMESLNELEKTGSYGRFVDELRDLTRKFEILHIRKRMEQLLGESP